MNNFNPSTLCSQLPVSSRGIWTEQDSLVSTAELRTWSQVTHTHTHNCLNYSVILVVVVLTVLCLLSPSALRPAAHRSKHLYLVRRPPCFCHNGVALLSLCSVSSNIWRRIPAPRILLSSETLLVLCFVRRPLCCLFSGSRLRQCWGWNHWPFSVLFR